MFKRGWTVLKIKDDVGTVHKLYPGDIYKLFVNIDFSKDETSIIVRAPITYSWDGYTLTKVSGP